jgi:hypothetical protein
MTDEYSSTCLLTRADAAARQSFLTKTYGHLLVAVVVFVLLEVTYFETGTVGGGNLRHKSPHQSAPSSARPAKSGKAPRSDVPVQSRPCAPHASGRVVPRTTEARAAAPSGLPKWSIA